MICPNCGYETEEDILFCEECGYSFTSEGNTTQASEECIKSSEDIIDDTEILNEGNFSGSENSEAESLTPKKKKFAEKFEENKKKYIIIGACVIFALAALIFTWSFILDKQTAVKDFNTAVSNISNKQEDIASKIKDSETLLSQTSSSDVAEANVLTDLQSAIDTAKNYSVDIPQISAKTSDIKKQTQDLANLLATLQSQYDDLTKNYSAVGSSVQKKIQAAVSEKHTYSYVRQDKNGYKQKVTITIGNWIKGSDTKLLQQAWKNFGGEGDYPVINSYQSNVYTSGPAVDYATSIVIFGTVKVENLSTEFSANKYNNGNSNIAFNIAGLNKSNSSLYDPVQVIAYESETKKQSNWGYGSIFITPKIEKNSWGPVKFYICVQNVFTPNYPDGDPAIDGVYFIASYDDYSSGKYKNEKLTINVNKIWN